MVNERFTLLLSPPNSPRMSDAPAKPHEYYSQYAPHSTQYDSKSVAQQGRYDNRPYAYDGGEHSLRSYKTTNWMLGQPTQSHYQGSQHEQHGRIVDRFHERMDPQGAMSIHTTDSQPTTGPVSASSSPTGRLTPRSESAHVKDQHDGDEIIDDYQDEDDGRPPMTKEERIAAKRKMKRFRLNHKQTRFLMSEFTKQAHPDAAHRERLAREIPGLSARQVQVWFQNRRAKLKRLTAEDRDRMMSSRALPANFDTTQALHAPFPGQHPQLGTQMPPMGSYPHYGDGGSIRPLAIDTLRRAPSYEHYGQPYTTVSGISPALGALSFTPPQSGSEHLSPSSAGGMFLNHQGPYSQARRPPIGLSGTSQPSYVAPPPPPRLPSNDRYATTLDEATGSYVRTSLPYSSLSHGNQPSHYDERGSSFSEQHQRPYAQRVPGASSAIEPPAYGLGFSYSQPTSYQQGEQQQHTAIAGGAQHATENEPYRDRGPPASYSQYENPSFSTSQIPQYPGYTAQYPPQNLSAGYQVTEAPRSEGQEQESYLVEAGPAQPYMH